MLTGLARVNHCNILAFYAVASVDSLNRSSHAKLRTIRGAACVVRRFVVFRSRPWTTAVAKRLQSEYLTGNRVYSSLERTRRAVLQAHRVEFFKGSSHISIKTGSELIRSLSLS